MKQLLSSLNSGCRGIYHRVLSGAGERLVDALLSLGPDHSLDQRVSEILAGPRSWGPPPGGEEPTTDQSGRRSRSVERANPTSGAGQRSKSLRE